jgi:hypothetical protein
VALPLSNLLLGGRWRLAREASQKSDSTREAGTKKQKSPWNRGGGANRLIRGSVGDKHEVRPFRVSTPSQSLYQTPRSLTLVSFLAEKGNFTNLSYVALWRGPVT